MFKKKYKKSEWFKGLLEAEQLYKEGYRYTCHTGLEVWFSKGDSAIGISGSTLRKVGAVDYVEHYNNNEELIHLSH